MPSQTGKPPLIYRLPSTGLPNVQDLNQLFNGATASVRDVYLSNSNGMLTINSVFTDWITVSSTEAAAAQVRKRRWGGVHICTSMRGTRNQAWVKV